MKPFDDLWPTLPIPGEYDTMDPLDQERWRGVIEAAYLAGYDEGLADAGAALQ